MGADEAGESGAGESERETERNAPKTWLGRTYRRLKKGYDLYDDASSLWDYYGHLKALLHHFFAVAKANTVATAATATVATTATVVAVVEPELLTDLFADDPQPQVERVETVRWGEAVVFPIEGVDENGRVARFEVAALPTDFAWARSSARTLTRDGAPLDADATAATVFAPPLRAGLAQSDTLIAVGVASQEGDVRVETRRARERALTAAGWLRAYVSAEAEIHLLNLGQFQPSCGADVSEGPSWQRPVLFIGVREAAEAVDLRAALIDAMADKSNLPDRACYSAFTIEPAPEG